MVRGRILARNLLLLIASYTFYGWWDWQFLSLIIVSTIVDFTVGQLLGRTDKAQTTRRKQLVVISVFFNLSLLGIFKYFDFFASSFATLATSIGLPISSMTLNVVLPVGISFYTFQTLSYSIDIYRGSLKPTNDFVTFATFVAFFPQLVAGPIERASSLLPQLSGKINITPEKIHSGLYLILWGYFKKVAIADTVAQYSDTVFANHELFAGLALWIGLVAFAIQIYCDFSGYSDIARGIARLMGIELVVNFRLPYLALSPSDFWNRWHISLSTWLRDYLYIPLGGNRLGNFKTYRNLMLTMLLGGLWHGAAWNFILWGAYHGTILVIFRLFDRSGVHRDPLSGEYRFIYIAYRWFLMSIIILYGWMLFRAESFDQILYFTGHLLVPDFSGGMVLLIICAISAPLLVTQYIQAKTKDLLYFTKLRIPIQIIVSIFLVVWMVVYGEHSTNEFIYFQF